MAENQDRKQLLEGFEKHKSKEGCDVEYLEHSNSSVMQFFDFCDGAGVEFKKLSLRTCREFQAYLYSEGYAASTINNRVSAVRVFYNYLMLVEVTMNNPFLLLTSLPHSPSIPVYVPIAEIKKIFSRVDAGEFIPTLDLAIFECMYGTGMKAIELRNLRVSDFSIPNESLIIWNKKSRRKLREVPLPAGSIYILKHYITFRKIRYPLAKFLFVSSRGKQLSHSKVRKSLTSFLRLSSHPGKKIINSIKYSYRNHLLKAGAKIENVALLVGSRSQSLGRHDESDFTHRLKKIHELFHPRG